MKRLLVVSLFVIINLITFDSIIEVISKKEKKLVTPISGIQPCNITTSKKLFDFTVVSQSSYERVHFLPYWSKRWFGSMCITFILTNETSSIFYSVLNTFNLPNRLHLIPHMVENMTVYPINYLRNIAIDHVKTSHFWLADMDMWPAPDLYSTLLSLPASYLGRDTEVTIVPAFEYALPPDAICDSFEKCITKIQRFLPTNKKELMSCLDTGYCNYFRVKSKTHSYHFRQWRYLPSDNQVFPLRCMKNDIQEPYVVVKLTKSLPRFDERFVNYGKNKVQWITHLRMAGYHFNLLSHSFAIDVPHPRSKISVDWFAEWQKTQGKTEMHLVLEKFEAELRSKYSEDNAKTPLCQVFNT